MHVINTTRVIDFFIKSKRSVTHLTWIGKVNIDCKIIKVILNALPLSHESFVQSMIALDMFHSLEKLPSKLILEEQWKDTTKWINKHFFFAKIKPWFKGTNTLIKTATKIDCHERAKFPNVKSTRGFGRGCKCRCGNY